MIEQLIYEMIKINGNDSKRIEHALKVHAFSKSIANGENLDSKALSIIESASILHDIGIQQCINKYGKSNGQLQQIEGPKVAKDILEKLGYTEEFIGRVEYLISKHHTYKNANGIDYQILIESDLIVNAIDGNITRNALKKAVSILFKTETGKHIAQNQFKSHDH